MEPALQSAKADFVVVPAPGFQPGATVGATVGAAACALPVAFARARLG